MRQFMLTRCATTWWLPLAIRHRVLRWCGVRLADFVFICPGIRFTGPDVSIGRHAFVNFDCLLDAAWAPITIGAEVFIAPRVVITTATHEIGPTTRRAGAEQRRAVAVHDGCWLGIGCQILPGVTVGAGCVVAAGAVVTSDCEPNGLYAGVPARRIRDLATDEDSSVARAQASAAGPR